MRVSACFGLLLGAVLAAGCGDRPARRAACAAPHGLKPDKYALLLNGDAERRHKQNVAAAYATLRALGFAANHVFVVSPRDRRARLLPETLRLTPAADNVFRALDDLAGRLRRGDLLLVYGTGHGDLTDDGEAYLAFRRGELWPDELRERVEPLAADTVIVMDQCFSGAFAEGFRGTPSRTIVISTVDARHETDCEFFAGAFWDAFLHPEAADRNRDGKTSVHEAFEVAIEADRQGLADDKDLASDGAYDAFNGFADALLN
jgi:hypothetical protein